MLERVVCPECHQSQLMRERGQQCVHCGVYLTESRLERGRLLEDEEHPMECVECGERQRWRVHCVRCGGEVVER